MVPFDAYHSIPERTHDAICVCAHSTPVFRLISSVAVQHNDEDVADVPTLLRLALVRSPRCPRHYPCVSAPSRVSPPDIYHRRQHAASPQHDDGPKYYVSDLILLSRFSLTPAFCRSPTNAACATAYSHPHPEQSSPPSFRLCARAPRHDAASSIKQASFTRRPRIPTGPLTDKLKPILARVSFSLSSHAASVAAEHKSCDLVPFEGR
ncbi:hypothetical protein C8R46DRAFT_1226127 [Mycena filopes]|nr:hypothetical protein C8R46DRAFT_1226127 [Mycena filopes]